MVVRNVARCNVLATDAGVAANPLARMKGLLGRRRLEPGEALLIESPGPIHTWFMRFAIDVVFLDNHGFVVGLRRCLRPFGAAGALGAAAVLELPAGVIADTGTAVGDRLAIEDRRRTSK
jgi:uncharacterized membrane protein (UPF0127 family)